MWKTFPPVFSNEVFSEPLVDVSDAKSDSFPQTGSIRTARLIEPVQKADSSAPDVIKQWCNYAFIF